VGGWSGVYLLCMGEEHQQASYIWDEGSCWWCRRREGEACGCPAHRLGQAWKGPQHLQSPSLSSETGWKRGGYKVQRFGRILLLRTDSRGLSGAVAVRVRVTVRAPADIVLNFAESASIRTVQYCSTVYCTVPDARVLYEYSTVHNTRLVRSRIVASGGT